MHLRGQVGHWQRCVDLMQPTATTVGSLPRSSALVAAKPPESAAFPNGLPLALASAAYSPLIHSGAHQLFLLSSHLLISRSYIFLLLLWHCKVRLLDTAQVGSPPKTKDRVSGYISSHISSHKTVGSHHPHCRDNYTTDYCDCHSMSTRFSYSGPHLRASTCSPTSTSSSWPLF